MAEAMPVQLEETGQGWQLLRDGKPYLIRVQAERWGGVGDETWHPEISIAQMRDKKVGIDRACPPKEVTVIISPFKPIPPRAISSPINKIRPFMC